MTPPKANSSTVTGFTMVKWMKSKRISKNYIRIFNKIRGHVLTAE
jgi:hypothetical protein